MDVYGNHQVVSIYSTGTHMRAEAINLDTGAREIRLVPLSELRRRFGR